MSESDTTNIEQLIALGASLPSAMREIGGIPVLPVPPGYRLDDLERFLPAPARQRGQYLVADATSFMVMWERFRNPNSMIFVDADTAKFTAVFDFSALDAPAWGRHRAVYAPKQSIDWAAWIAGNGKRMPQVEFAEFIENNLGAIIKPTAAEMLEISTHLVAHRDIKFESATRLQTGQTQFRYDETVRGQVAHSSIEVPDRFTLGLSPFFLGQTFEIEARLRYRIQERLLVMWYDLDRPKEFFQKAVMQLADQILTQCTDSTVIFGSPEGR